MLGDSPPEEPLARLDLVTAGVCEHIVEYEPKLRAQLRLSLQPGSEERDELVLRKGRAVKWLAEALAPLEAQLKERELQRLVLAIRATVGIEPFVWLVDVARLSPTEAVDVMRSSARTLLMAAMQNVRSDQHP